MIERREFIRGIGLATAWPLAARAQQLAMRRIGVLMNLAADDPEIQARLAPFLQGLQEVGWTVGRNVRIDYRWGAGDPDRVRRFAAELVALAPDVILASGGTTVAPLQQVTRTVPIVFVNVTDPVGSGFVVSLGRPGRNATGFTLFEYSISGKWLELLRQIAPGVTRVAVLRDAGLTSGGGQLGSLQGAAQSAGMELRPVGVREADEIERGIAAFAGIPNCGLIVTSSSFASFHRELIVSLAAKYQLPAVYFTRQFVDSGGLISFGPDLHDAFRNAAVYIGRILKGEKPADLPVQQAVKVELVINLKTAKALGLTIPETLLATADEVIQ
jgi:putative tryptophan/tyrosine transport system substrate-binding protein